MKQHLYYSFRFYSEIKKKSWRFSDNTALQLKFKLIFHLSFVVIAFVLLLLFFVSVVASMLLMITLLLLLILVITFVFIFIVVIVFVLLLLLLLCLLLPLFSFLFLMSSMLCYRCCSFVVVTFDCWCRHYSLLLLLFLLLLQLPRASRPFATTLSPTSIHGIRPLARITTFIRFFFNEASSSFKNEYFANHHYLLAPGLCLHSLLPFFNDFFYSLLHYFPSLLFSFLPRHPIIQPSLFPSTHFSFII